MGDPDGDYFEEEAFEPKIYYYDAQENEFHDEETLAAQGVKLIGYEYPTPIENSLVFSHFSYLRELPCVLSLLLFERLCGAPAVAGSGGGAGGHPDLCEKGKRPAV